MSVLARLSLSNRGLVGLLSLLVIGFGVIALPSLRQQLFPSIQLPAAVVVAPYPGASPDVVDSEIGPMSCWMPRKMTTESVSAPT